MNKLEKQYRQLLASGTNEVHEAKLAVLTALKRLADISEKFAIPIDIRLGDNACSYVPKSLAKFSALEDNLIDDWWFRDRDDREKLYEGWISSSDRC